METLYSDIYGEIEKNNWYWKKSSDLWERLNSRSAVYARSTKIQSLMVDHCDVPLEMIGPVANRVSGFAMRKNHPLLTNISKLIVQYLGDGTIQNIVDSYTEKCPVTKPLANLPRADVG